MSYVESSTKRNGKLSGRPDITIIDDPTNRSEHAS